MQRNTFIVIFVLAVFAAIVVGVNIGRSTQRESPISTISPTPSIVPTPTTNYMSYSSAECGISFAYPDTYTKVEIETGGVTLASKKDEGSSIVMICQEEIPRVPLPKDKIGKVKIGSVSANLYHDTSAKDGTPIDKLIFTHPKLKKDVYIAGLGDEYETLLTTLKIQ